METTPEDKKKFDKKAYKKKYYQENREYIKNKSKKYRSEHVERCKMYHKKYREENVEKVKTKKRRYEQENVGRVKIYRKKYRKENSEYFKKYYREYEKNKRITNPIYKLVKSLRGRVRMALKYQGTKKSTKTLELLGASKEIVRNHLESLFVGGMTWENHGPKGWHIDHIKPCSSFDLTDLEQQKICFHYTNLQPLWWFENLSKGDNLYYDK